MDIGWLEACLCAAVIFAIGYMLGFVKGKPKEGGGPWFDQPEDGEW